jgi:toxin CcdB
VERLNRFDIAMHNEIAMVVIESDLLPPDPAIVVIPLLRDYPAVRYLNPTIRVGDDSFILATRLVGAVRRASLRRAGSASQQADEITRAVDILMAGV